MSVNGVGDLVDASVVVNHGLDRCNEPYDLVSARSVWT